MVRIGGSPGRSTSGFWSSSAKPFLNDLMPLATSPMMSEILPLPPNTSNMTAPTMSQCQIDRPPMTQISVSNARRAAARHGENLGFPNHKNKKARRRSHRNRERTRSSPRYVAIIRYRAAINSRNPRARAKLLSRAQNPRNTLVFPGRPREFRRQNRRQCRPRADLRPRQVRCRRKAPEYQNPAADGRRIGPRPSVPQDPEGRRSPQARSESEKLPSSHK